MTSALDLSTLGADELRQLASRLLEEMRGKRALIDKLMHEMAILNRLKAAASSEAYTGEQQRVLSETLDTDIEARTAVIEQLTPTKPADDEGEKQQPKRTALPALLPRKEVCHDPDSTTCSCDCELQRMGGEDVAEKIDYQRRPFWNCVSKRSGSARPSANERDIWILF